MKDPFKAKKDPMVAIAHLAVPLLLDRLGGTTTVSELELAGLSERYGGSVGVRAREESPGVYRLTLERTDPAPVDPERPVS